MRRLLTGKKRSMRSVEENLPVVLEEAFHNTQRFIGELADGVTVIVPHLGLLGGGFMSLSEAGLSEMDTVWADTAPGPAGGHSRLHRPLRPREAVVWIGFSLRRTLGEARQV